MNVESRRAFWDSNQWMVCLCACIMAVMVMVVAAAAIVVGNQKD